MVEALWAEAVYVRGVGDGSPDPLGRVRQATGEAQPPALANGLEGAEALGWFCDAVAVHSLFVQPPFSGGVGDALSSMVSR
jgi:hypothetical protein